MLWLDHKYAGLCSPRLERFSKKGDDLYNFRCPFCGDSHKNRFKARGYLYKTKSGLSFKCHNCGHGTNMHGLLKEVDPLLVKQYNIEKYKEGQGRNRPEAANNELDFIPKFKPKMKWDFLISLEDLDSNHPGREYIRNRQLPESELLWVDNVQSLEQLSPEYEDRIIGTEGRIVIPFKNEQGIFAFQARAIDNNRFRYMTIKLTKDEPLVYGMDKINRKERVYVTEGPFDSMFLPNAVAVGGADLSRALHKLDKTRTTLVFDNTPRNKEVVKIMEKAEQGGYSVCVWPKEIEEKDINEMILAGYKAAEILEIINQNTASTLKLKLAITDWKKC
tara:strand:- start:158 stop:1156 length:999 start_codon:yes stop_codon:yes gene_type:complete